MHPKIIFLGILRECTTNVLVRQHEEVAQGFSGESLDDLEVRLAIRSHSLNTRSKMPGLLHGGANNMMCHRAVNTPPVSDSKSLI